MVNNCNCVFGPTSAITQIGACRLCVVKIEGLPDILTACTTQAETGMVA
ncbi:2Fe-2S iron-sulfur cluster-binding protein [Desulfosporosinus burensis]